MSTAMDRPSRTSMAFDKAHPVTMKKLSELSTEELSDFCGQCHRTWAQIAADGPHDINNVRFQPYRLANSKCYDPSDKAHQLCGLPQRASRKW